MLHRVCLALALLPLVALNGCKRSGPSNVAAPEKVLNIYIWSEYLPDSVVEQFVKETGIRVNVDVFDSNEKLLEKLSSGAVDYDIVVPSDYAVQAAAGQKLLQPIDHAKLTGWSNLDPAQLNPKFDPGNQYSMPYFWGTTGLGYRKGSLAEPVDSWSVLFDPANEGKVLMLDDVRECFAVALKRMGKSVNETDPAVLKQAADMLKAQNRQVHPLYDSETFDKKLQAGDVSFSHGYNGQLAKVVAAAPQKFGYVVPKEGATRWMDNLCIPASAPHAESAYAFMNFVLRPEVNAKIVESVGYASPNAAAKKLIPKRIVDDPNIYTPPDVLQRCEFMQDLGDRATLLDRYWTEIKAK